MDAIFYFLFWAALIFLMMRFGCGSHVMGHGHGKSDPSATSATESQETFKWVPPEKDVDPVCGKTIRTHNAKPSVHDGNVYYFCSRECREVFEAAPNLYISPHPEQSHPRLESDHV